MLRRATEYRARVTIGCLLVVLASAAHGQTIQANAADERAIRDLIALHASASQQGDFDGLMVLSRAHPDARQVGTNPMACGV